MGFFRRLFSRPSGRAASRPDAGDEPVRPDPAPPPQGISLQATYSVPSEREIEAALQPIARARAAGVQNNPPTGQQDLSADEDAIVLYFKNFLRVTEQKVSDGLATLRNDLEREQTTVMVPSVDRAFAKLDGELRTLKLEWTAWMIQANRERLETWRHLRLFKVNHRIERQAAYSDAFYFDFMLLAALVLLETAGNAIFYRTGNEFGYVGGLANAFLISVVNVFIAFFLLGFLSLRHLHVRRLPLRILAALGTGVSVFGIGLMNLAAAQYRDMLTSFSQPEAIDAVGAAFGHGFNLKSLPALALLLFGYTLAALAAYKGYYFDDPIPGFGALTRKYEHARHVQRTTENDFRFALNAAARRHAEAVERDIAAFRRGVQGRQTAIALYHQIRTYFPDYQRNVVQRKCDATLRRYREENASVRTSATPAAFGRYPSVVFDPALPELPAGLRDLREEIAELATADRTYAQLHAAFLDRVEAFYASIEHEIVAIETMAAARLDRQEASA